MVGAVPPVVGAGSRTLTPEVGVAVSKRRRELLEPGSEVTLVRLWPRRLDEERFLPTVLDCLRDLELR